jgi:hypothetical protein
VLVIGLIGGVAMASVAGARRTQSSYPTFLASTNPSDMTMAVYNATANGGPGPSLTRQIEALPGVKKVRTFISPPIVPLNVKGAPRLSTLGYVIGVGSLDGLLTKQDRLGLIQGHLMNSSAINQVEMTPSAARIFGVHLNQMIPLGLYDNAQESEPGFGTPKVRPLLLVHAKVVGIVELNSDVVQDGVDQSFGFVFLTPAYLRKALSLSPGHDTPALYDLQLTRGGQGVAALESDLAKVVPRGYTYEFHVTSRVTSETELAIKPEAIALGAFGLIAALACLVLASQAIARLLRSSEDDRRILRSLGARPLDTVGEGLIGVTLAVLLGSLLALVVAVGLSPLAPLGPVRPVYPDPGVAFDWMVLGLGLAILVLGLGAVAFTLSLRGAPHRATRSYHLVTRRSSVVRSAQRSGLPVAGVVGVHFALESGRGRTTTPVRSVLVGTVLAVALVVATLTFASGLSTLVSRPSLYGWNWNYALNPTNDVPPVETKLLNHDRDVAAWSGFNYTDAAIDGKAFPILLTNPRDKVSPPILSGHEVDTNHQIVLGAATMASLHKKIGDTVEVSYGGPKDAPVFIPPTKLTIVGTATLPAVGYSSFVSEHTSMGTGAIVPIGITPPAMTKAINSPDPNLNGWELIFVRLAPGVSDQVGRANLQRVDRAANKVFANDKHATGNSVTVLDVVRPAQIVNYRSIGSTPIFLAVGLALGAVVALGLTLIASVRRRRRDLALLKSFGFTHGQLAGAVAWQATVNAVVGIVIGIPLGIVVGRELWTLFARNINAVPDPTVPVVPVILVGIGTLVFTNLVAVLPGRSAARTSTALVLRAE